MRKMRSFASLGFSLVEVSLALAVGAVISLGAGYVVVQSKSVEQRSSIQADLDRQHYMTLQKIKNVDKVRLAVGIPSNLLLTNCFSKKGSACSSFAMPPAAFPDTSAVSCGHDCQIRTSAKYTIVCTPVSGNDNFCQRVDISVATTVHNTNTSLKVSFLPRAGQFSIPAQILVDRAQVDFSCASPDQIATGINWDTMKAVCQIVTGISVCGTASSGSVLPRATFGTGQPQTDCSPVNKSECPTGYAGVGLAYGQKTCMTPVLAVAPICVPAWAPNVSTICQGVGFTQTDSCGASRPAVGTWIDASCCVVNPISWAPLASNYCPTDTFSQTNNCGGTRAGVGTKSCSCVPTTWTPLPSQVCSTAPYSPFTQTSNCGTTNSGVMGTKVCVGPCVVSTWSPATSTNCLGVAFTQTSNCGTTQNAVGTMGSSWTPSDPADFVPANNCPGSYVFTDQNNCANPKTQTLTGTKQPNWQLNGVNTDPTTWANTHYVTDSATFFDSNGCQSSKFVTGILATTTTTLSGAFCPTGDVDPVCQKDSVIPSGNGWHCPTGYSSDSSECKDTPTYCTGGLASGNIGNTCTPCCKPTPTAPACYIRIKTLNPGCGKLGVYSTLAACQAAGIGGLVSCVDDSTAGDLGCGGCGPIAPITPFRTCFIAGTQVSMSEGGTKAIEEIQVGDEILTYDEISRQYTISPVEEVFHHQEELSILYTFAFEGFSVTSNDIHPFFIPRERNYFSAKQIFGRWIRGENIELLTNKNGLPQKILSIQKSVKKVPLYNLHVTSPYDQPGHLAAPTLDQIGHNYFANGVLVHNVKMGGCLSDCSVYCDAARVCSDLYYDNHGVFVGGNMSQVNFQTQAERDAFMACYNAKKPQISTCWPTSN